MANWPTVVNTDGAAQQHVQSPVIPGQSPNGRHITAIYNADNHAALVAQNDDGVDAVAIQADGKVVVTAVNTAGSVGLHVINPNADASSLGVKIDGNLRAETGDGIVMSFKTHGGDQDEDLMINKTGTGEGTIGLGWHAGVGVSRLTLQGNTPGNTGARVEAMMDTSGNHRLEGTLYLNHDEGNCDVIISHDDSFEGANNPAVVRVFSPRMTLGTPNVVAGVPQIGHLDGNGTELDPLDIRFGTRNVTADVIIGNVDHTVRVESELRVGTGDPGLIDAVDGADLKIGGGDQTAELFLGNANNLVKVLGAILTSGQPVWLDENSEFGVKYDSLGHGGGASFDIFVAGSLKAWLSANSNAWTVIPPEP